MTATVDALPSDLMIELQVVDFSNEAREGVKEGMIASLDTIPDELIMMNFIQQERCTWMKGRQKRLLYSEFAFSCLFATTPEAKILGRYSIHMTACWMTCVGTYNAEAMIAIVAEKGTTEAFTFQFVLFTIHFVLNRRNNIISLGYRVNQAPSCFGRESRLFR